MAQRGASRGRAADGPDRTEQAYPSTTWEWRRVKIKAPAAPQGGSAAKPHRFRGLAPWARRDPLTLTVRYRGGEECWIEVKSRGRTARYPGHLSLYDVLTDVWQTHL